MSKNFILRLLLIIFCSLMWCTISAQQTFYYKLVRTIESGKNHTNVSGGQFITFTPSLCYESDCKGRSVGHGQLVKKADKNYNKYTGNSYWGKAEYIFTPDNDFLNIITANGGKYVYKKSIAPKGVYTCSLIRRNKENVNTSTAPIINYPSAENIHTVPSNSNSGSSQNVKNNSVPSRKKTTCAYTGTTDKLHCGGDGKCSRCGGDGLMDGFGINNVRCSQCKGTGKCISCNGSGYISF